MASGSEIAEREFLQELVSTQGWQVYFRNILSKHRQVLMDKSHSALRRGDFHEAKEYLARADEPNLIINLVKNRLNELKAKENE